MNLEPEHRIEEYILIESLSEYSLVWQAYDENSQREVVLKFVEDRASADREGIVLADMDHPNILKLLRRFEYRDMPVLVFEYVPGVRLDKAIRQGLSREESFRVCTDICSALKSVHQFGLFHGDLSPFNVIWSATKSKAYLIDFGAIGGCTVLSAAPEHDPESRIPLGPYTDMVGFGRVLMSLCPKMKGLYERCLQDSPDLRPTSDEALKILVKARDKGKIMVRGSILVALFMVLGWSSYAISVNGRKLSPDQKIQQHEANEHFDSVQELRKLLRDPEFAGYEDRIIKSIARLNEKLGEETAFVAKKSELVAVFALKEGPIVVLRDGILKLGSYASIEGDYGWIAEINRGNLILKTENGSKEVRFLKPLVIARKTMEYQPISIFPGRFNLDIVFSAICEATGRNFLGNPGQGVISGGFGAKTYEEFLESLGDQIYYDEFNLRINSSRMPISIIAGQESWYHDDVTLAEELALYSPHTGYECVYTGDNNESGIHFPFMQFHELLEVMELDYVINDIEILIYEKGGNDE